MRKFQLKKFLKTKRLFVGLLVSYFAIFVFTSTFLLWMYVESDSKVKENLTEYNLACVEHTSEIIDNFCSELETIAHQMRYSPLVDSVMYERESYGGYDDYESFLDHMARIKYKYNFIEDAYLYIPEKDIVYAESAIIDSESYFNEIRKYKNYEYNEWKNVYLTGVYFHKYFPVEPIDEYGVTEINVVTYSNSYLKKGTNQVAAYFNVLIDVDKMLNSIDEIKILNNVQSFAVYDMDNNVVFKTGGEVPDKSIVEEHLKKGLRLSELGKKNVFYAPSKVKIWTYSIVTDSDSFLDEMSGFTMKLRVIILFNIIVGILMVILSVFYTYRPLKKVIADITGNKTDNILNENYEIGEVELLKTIFSEQKKTILEFEGVVIKQEQLIKENALKKILFAQTDDGQSGNDELSEFNAEMYGAAVLLLREQQSDEFKNEIQLIEYAVSNMFSDVLNDNYNINIVKIKNGKLALVVNLEQERIENWFRDLQFIGEYISSLMISEYNVELFVGAGQIYGSLSETSKSFTEALSSLNFHTNDEDVHVILYRELLEQETQSRYYYYPYEAESEIIDSVIVGDYNRAKMILEDIDKTNDKLGIDDKTRYRLNSNLIACYQNVAVAYALEPVRFTDDDIKGSTSAVIKNIKSQYRKLCGGAGMAKFNKSEKLVEEIRAYVCEHYFENSLSLNVISEHFGITRQYLSTLYRSVTGEKLVDFITKVRIEKAKEIMKNRSLSINQIAEKVGFTNDISLIRAFKRVEGVTPGYYRDNL